MGSGVSESVTEHIPLVGAEGYHAMVNQVDRLAKRVGLPRWRLQRLLDRYGSMTDELLALAEDDPTLLEPLDGAEEYLRVEIAYAASHEGALHLDDVLARRTRISIETPDRGTKSAQAAPTCRTGPRLGRASGSPTRSQSYADRVEAERRSQEQDGRPSRRRGPDRRTRHPGRRSRPRPRLTDAEAESPSGRGPRRATDADAARSGRARRRDSHAHDARPLESPRRSQLGVTVLDRLEHADAPLGAAAFNAPYDVKPCRHVDRVGAARSTAMMSSRFDTPGLASGS